MLCCMMLPFSLTMAWSFLSLATDTNDVPDVNLTHYSTGEVRGDMKISRESIFLLKVSFFALFHFWCSSPCFSFKNKGGRPS